jgi:CxxC motif-containing protein
MKKDYTCIACPLGCPVTLDAADPANLAVTGNKCPKGREYAIEEYADPKRVVTTTVASDSPLHPRVPVKTSAAIQKQHIDALLQHLSTLQVHLPVTCGEVLVENFRETGVQIRIARSFEPDSSGKGVPEKPC